MTEPTPPKLDSSMRVRHAAVVLSAEVAGTLVFMSVEKGCYLGLDEIGTDVWNRLKETTCIADLVISLVDEYDADSTTIEREVLDLLNRMAAHGLLEID